MDLSNEDALRLNVLMQQPVEAVRINESTMTLYALLSDKEVNIKLSPTGNDDRYLRAVRQLLSGYALGSPEGFPVYLQRWNRMGQIKSEKLEGLLKIAEPEAVLAVVQSEQLTEDIARRAWWCMTSSDIARLLLSHELIRESELAKELVEFLLEFLPFEEDISAQIESAKQVVLSGQMTDEQIRSLWQKGKRKIPLRIGFLAADSALIPEPAQENHNLLEETQALLSDETVQTEFKSGLAALAEESGQKFLKGINEALNKLPNQEAAIRLYDVIFEHFAWANPDRLRPRSWDALIAARQQLQDLPNLESTDAKTIVSAVQDLSLLSQMILNPVLSQTDAIGSVMRKKLSELTEAVQQRLGMLILD